MFTLFILKPASTLKPLSQGGGTTVINTLETKKAMARALREEEHDDDVPHPLRVYAYIYIHTNIYLYIYVHIYL